jgi:tetratricopeptide (TPR) repeat protein
LQRVDRAADTSGMSLLPANEPPPQPRIDRLWWPLLAAILLVAIVVRGLYLAQFATLPFFAAPVGDSAAHLARATEIAAGKLLPSRPFFYCSIFYPYFLAVVLGALHGSLVWVCAMQLLAGVVVVALLARMARALFGTLAGLAAGTLAALYGPSAFLEADILGVAWGQLTLAVAMAACLAWSRASERGREGGAALLGLAGLAFGFAIVERPNLLIVALLTAAWCARASSRRDAIRGLASFALGVALPLAAVLALNVVGTGQWVPLTTSSGINLYLGYHPGATGTFEEPWEHEAPEFAARNIAWEETSLARASIEAGHPLTPQQASDWWRQKAVAFIVSHPGEAAWITVRKAALLLNADEVPNHLDFGFIRERAPALWLMPIGFGAVLGLGVLGAGDALRRRQRRRQVAFLLLVAGGTLLGLLPFTVTDRYRATLVPPLIVAAGAGVAALLRLARRRDERAARGVPAVLGATLVAVLVAALPLQRPLHGRDYWMLAEAHQANGNLPAAADAYERALAADGDRAEVYNNLALVDRAMGRRAKAEAELRRAIAVNPRLSYPHKNLGMLLIGSDQPDSALVELRVANRLAPDDAQTLAAIGALLAERGDAGGAAAAFAAARRLAPGDRRLADLMRRYASEPRAAVP